MNPEIFPDKLKSARLIRGWSLRELAAQTGGQYQHQFIVALRKRGNAAE